MSEHQKISWQLLFGYIKGEASAKERKQVERWLNDDPERQQILLQLEKIWETPAEKKQNWDVEASWKRFENRYGPVKDDALVGLSTYKHSTTAGSEPGKKYFGARLGYNLAAGFILMLIVVFAVINYPANESAEPTMQEVMTEKGERTTLKLNDGSRVILNANSKLQIPSDYGETARILHLEGEAFFEVEHNEERVFRVYTGEFFTEDLGTKFNIRSYDPDQPVQVVVSEGLVELGSSGKGEAEKTVINPNQMGAIGRDGSVNVSDVSDLSLYLGWTSGQLVFKDEQFKKVRTELERWYNIETSVTDPELDKKQLTATFEDEPLREVLKVIAISFQIDYTQEGRSVVFKPKTEADGSLKIKLQEKESQK